jgi:hypothetical protein
MPKRSLHDAALFAFAAILRVQPAVASVLSTWTWSSLVVGVPVSGSVVFSTQADGAGFDLVIDLSNTSTTLPAGTAQVLDGLYFDVTPAVGDVFSMKSAIADVGLLTNSASTQTVPTPGTAGTNICAPGAGGTGLAPSCAITVGGGWETAFGASGVGGGAGATEHYAIGTTGQGGVFIGNPNTGVGAFNYGIAGPGGVNPTLDGLGGAYPAGYVFDTATFTLSGLTSQNIALSNVEAAYGTAPEGTPTATLATVPESASLGMFTGGAMLLALATRRRVTRFGSAR